MWSIVACVVTLLIVCITHWSYKWKNPKCSGTLPPGSMGFPLIGETLQFLKPSHSLDILPFFKKRIQRYGPLFRTSLAGRRVVVSADPEVNQFLFQQEGKLVEMWYLDVFAQLFRQDGTCNATGHVHKYLRNVILNHFGHESLKDKLLNKAEHMARQCLHSWSTKSSVELKHVTSTMIFDLITMELFSYDPKKSSVNMSDAFMNFLEGLMSFPIDIPGSTFRKCLKNQRKILNMMRDIVKERLASPQKRYGDLLECFLTDMKDNDNDDAPFLTEDFIVYTMFGLLFASFESIPSTLTLAIKLLTEHPLAIQEVMDEHDGIHKKRENINSSITWEDYKSMTFTQQVINETLRMANVGLGILRRALKDVEINGAFFATLRKLLRYTIPAGWSIMIVPAVLHMDPNTYTDPLMFNPWRWKEDLGLKVSSKNFTPFGGGVRSCTGAEFSKMFMVVFLHVLVTNYRWTKIRGGKIIRNPILVFEDGYHIKVWEKEQLRLCKLTP